MISWMFPDVRDNERQRFRFFLSLAALLLTGQAISMTACESLLLTRLGVAALPAGVLLASAMTLVASFVYGKRIGKHRHEDLFLGILTVSALVVASSIPLVKAGLSAGFFILFAFHCVTFTIFTTHFDTLAGDYFDTLSAKRILPLLGVGATLGEICGGLSASALTRVISTESLLLVWLGMLVLAALYLVISRPRLREWNPAQPTGITRTEGGGSGFGAFQRYGLARSLGFTLVAAVGAMSVVQYVASDVFVTSFPEEHQLAAFLGGFLALTNIIELLVGAKLTPWLIRRFGVTSTNLIHPIGALLTLGLLQVHYALLPAMLAWMNRKMVHDAIARPVKALLFNAFPQHERGGLRAFLQGVLASSARAVAGLALVLLQGRLLGPDFVVGGLVLAALYVSGATLVRSQYLQTLVRGLADGRLKWGRSEELEVKGTELRKHWSRVLARPEETVLDRLLNLLGKAADWEALESGLDHPESWVRVKVVRALGEHCPDAALRDPDREVRLEALKQLSGEPQRCEELTQDSEPEIRRLAEAVVGRLEWAEMEPWLVEFAHQDYIPQVLASLDSSVPEVKLASLSRLCGYPNLPLERLGRELKATDEAVVIATLKLLGGSPDPLASVMLAESLKDPRAALRATAATCLGQRGERVLPHLEAYLRSPTEATVESTYDAIALTDCERAHQLLGQELRLLVRRAWRALFLGRAVENHIETGEFLSLALRDDADRSQRLAYRVLTLLEGERTVGPVVQTLRFSNSSARASALEVLSNLGDREAANLLVLLTERSTPLEERLRVVARTAPSLGRVPVERTELLAQCTQFPGRFVRLAALGCLGKVSPDLAQLFLELSSCELFSELSLEQLDEVHGDLVSERFGTDEQVLREGEPCDRLYLLQEGQLDQPTRIIGEVPALDGGLVRRIVVAQSPCRFWSLDVRHLRRLVHRHPGLAFPLMQRLSRKLKRASAS